MATCPTCGGSFADATFCPRDGARLAEDLGDGVMLDDRYRLVRQVGAGAIGIVYEAEHVHIHRRVAVKVLKHDHSRGSEAVKRFEREAQTTSDLGHPNIIQCRDFGYARDGRVYMVMEWLDGETLATRLEREGVDIPTAIEIAIQTCAGLAEAHAREVIHRDLKPANLFLGGDRVGTLRVKILDFGIAKLAEHQVALTATGVVIGTPNYMSPEQALGDHIDPRADLYALGVILYEMVTGAVPFQGDSALSVLHQHSMRIPVAPSKSAPHRHIPPAVEQVVMRCLEKQPTDRYASANDLRAALEQTRAASNAPAPTLRHEPASGVHAEPRSTAPVIADDAELPPRRRRAPWIVAGVLAGGAIATVVWVATCTSDEATRPHDAALVASVADSTAAPPDAMTPLALADAMTPALADAMTPLALADAPSSPDAVDAGSPTIEVVAVGERATALVKIPEVPVANRPVQITGTLSKLGPALVSAMAAGELHVTLDLEYWRTDEHVFHQTTHADRDGHFGFTVTLAHAAKHHAVFELRDDHEVLDRIKLQLYEQLTR